MFNKLILRSFLHSCSILKSDNSIPQPEALKTNNYENNYGDLKLKEDLKEINPNDLSKIIGVSYDPEVVGFGKETVLYNKNHQKELANTINKFIREQKQQMVDFDSDYLNSWFNYFEGWRKSPTAQGYIANKAMDSWERCLPRLKPIAQDLTEGKEINNSDLTDINNLIHENKETIRSHVKIENPLTPNKPLGTAGDITINDLLNKGMEVFDSPILQMIRENVSINQVGIGITSMLIYKSIVKLYLKSTYGIKYIEKIPGQSTRSREIALFMIMGAPMITAAIMGINYATKKDTKVIVNIIENNNTDVPTNSTSISQNSLFLFLNKLPKWLKIILKYIAISFIFSFITGVIGYKSTILIDISNQFHIYLGYFIKLYAILNLLVVIYYIWKLYTIVIFANNKDFIIPDSYPKFIKDDLLDSKEIALQVYSVEPRKVYKHYLKLILLYILIIISGLTVLVYLTP